MNKIRTSGYVDSEPKFSHKTFGEDFYSFDLSVYRRSGVADILPCIIPSTLVSKVKKNLPVDIVGEIRTRNTFYDNKNHCELNVFVSDILDFTEDTLNNVELHGFVCKEPKLRETPFGRKICDVIVACQRERVGKSDYIPCIAWGRNSLRMSELKVGTEVIITGRLQSRTYEKQNDDGTFVIKTTYELSVNAMEEVKK